MLTFFSTRKHRYTFETYLEIWAPELRSQVRSVAYEDLPAEGQLTPGTYVFCDQERLAPRQLRLAVALWAQLEEAAPAVCLLNDPRRVLTRYALLKKLHQCGQNVFDVHSVRDAFRPTRRPVFLHSHAGHEGPLSPLINNRAALLFWVLFNWFRRPWARLMVEEFCDVSVEGVCSKYGAFHLEGVILPRHLFFGDAWALKGAEIPEDDQLNQVESYLLKNPHALELQKIFAIAGIDFGRMDYAFQQGRLQVWEINTNPMIIGHVPEGTPQKVVTLAAEFNARIKPELLRLSSLSRGDKAVHYRLASRF